VQLGSDAAALTALANHSVAQFQSGASQHLGQALAMYLSLLPHVSAPNFAFRITRYLLRYEEAGRGGDADAWYNLGILHYNGIGVPVDKQLSLKCIRKAADLGDAAAHFFLYSQCDPSTPAAKHHLETAAAAGHAEAIYYKAMELQDIPDKFIPALVRAAEKGSTSAAAALGSLHYDGTCGAVQSAALAAKWWVIAANAGHAGASHNIAVMYEFGVPEIGFKQDFSMCPSLHLLPPYPYASQPTPHFPGRTRGTAPPRSKATPTACSAWQT
jgi:TPR repeat protein